MQIDKPQPRPIRVMRKIRVLAYLRMRGWARCGLVGTSPVTVSLTSYGDRLAKVSRVIESIGAGTVKPRRLVLWVSDPDFDLANYPELGSLQRRGLEIKHCHDYRSFKKFYPCALQSASYAPLVVADDDILYPGTWLETLMRAHAETPEMMVGVRGLRMELSEDGKHLAPYITWPKSPGVEPSARVFLTTGAGTVFPRRLLDELARVGDGFMEVCSHADDVWVNWVAQRCGVPKRWIPNDLQALSLPGSQGEQALHTQNVGGGRNDAYLRALYGQREIEQLELG